MFSIAMAPPDGLTPLGGHEPWTAGLRGVLGAWPSFTAHPSAFPSSPPPTLPPLTLLEDSAQESPYK